MCSVLSQPNIHISSGVVSLSQSPSGLRYLAGGGCVISLKAGKAWPGTEMTESVSELFDVTG